MAESDVDERPLPDTLDDLAGFCHQNARMMRHVAEKISKRITDQHRDRLDRDLIAELLLSLADELNEFADEFGAETAAFPAIRPDGK